MQRVFDERMPAGIPGDVTRKRDSTLEPGFVGDTALAYGAPVKLDAKGRFAPVTAGDTAIYGFLARPYPSGGGQGGSASGQDGMAAPGSQADVMRRGYMSVRVASGAPAKNGQVHVRLADGGIVAAEDAGNTLAVPACAFMGAADGSGNTEISYHI